MLNHWRKHVVFIAGMAQVAAAIKEMDGTDKLTAIFEELLRNV